MPTRAVRCTRPARAVEGVLGAIRDASFEWCGPSRHRLTLVVETGELLGDRRRRAVGWSMVVIASRRDGLASAVASRLRCPNTADRTDAMGEEQVEPASVSDASPCRRVLVGGARLGRRRPSGRWRGLAPWAADGVTTRTAERRRSRLPGATRAARGADGATLLVLELAKPHRRRFTHAVFGSLVSATVCFAVFYPIAGTTFLGLYDVPSYGYKDWHLLAAVGLGLAAALGALVLAVLTGIVRRLPHRLKEDRSVPVAAGWRSASSPSRFPDAVHREHQRTRGESGRRSERLPLRHVWPRCCLPVCMGRDHRGPSFPMLFLGGVRVTRST